MVCGGQYSFIYRNELIRISVMLAYAIYQSHIPNSNQQSTKTSETRPQAQTTFTTHLLFLFNSIFLQDAYPPDWKLVIIFLILKPGKNFSAPTSYRPMALSSVLDELFQNILK